MKTKIEFDIEATQATEKNDCVLFLAIAGNRGTIRKKLQSMIDEIDSSYEKPIQGIVCSFYSISHVITPVWKGMKY